MKKICTLLLFAAVNAAFGQSTTILPANIDAGANILKTVTGRFGFEHTDGTVRFGTYVNNESGSEYLGGWLQTFTNHPLVFSTSDGDPQLYLNPEGYIILNPSDGKTGNVGIGLPRLTVPAEKLTVQGGIRSSVLAGIGSRSVSADANGTLTTAAQTYTVAVPPQAFQRAYNSGGGTFAAFGPYGDCYIVGSNINEELVAPVIVPAGAIITQVQAFFTDNDATNNLKFEISYSTFTDTANGTVVSLFQNTNNPQPYTVTTLTSGTLSENVVNDKTYRIRVFATNSAGAYGTGVWNYTGGVTNHLSVKGVKITYTL